jgi:hypothetical protein
MIRIIPALALAIVFTAVPALASDTTQVPEGSSMTLFAIGLAGLVIGRTFAAKRRGGGRD